MKGYGHSTVAEGLRVLNESGAKRMVFVHHDPRHNDEMLKAMEKQLGTDRALFARAGDVIEL